MGFVLRHHPPHFRYEQRLVQAGQGTGTHWAAIATAAFAAVAAGGAIFAAKQVREARTGRLALAAADLAQKWSSPALEESRELVGSFATTSDLADAFEVASRDNTHAYYVLVREPNFFEDLGVAVKLKALDIDLIRYALGSVVVTRWEQWREAITRMRGAEAAEPHPRHDLAFSEFYDLACAMARGLGMPTPRDAVVDPPRTG